MSRLALTGSQTIGPFFAPALLREDMRRNVLVGPDTAGERITIKGHVFDGERVAVADALVEIWQANAHGRYHHPADQRAVPLDPAFLGFGRCATDESGQFWFETIKPGVVPSESGAPQAPHIVVTVFARGLLNHLVTRLYFADEPANASDPVLGCVPTERRATLLAQPSREDGRTVYHFDLLLRGDGETAFLNL